MYQSEYDKEVLGYLVVIQTHILSCATINISCVYAFIFLKIMLFL